MYRIGQPEIDAVARVIESRSLFKINKVLLFFKILIKHCVVIFSYVSYSHILLLYQFK